MKSSTPSGLVRVPPVIMSINNTVTASFEEAILSLQASFYATAATFALWGEGHDTSLGILYNTDHTQAFTFPSHALLSVCSGMGRACFLSETSHADSHLVDSKVNEAFVSHVLDSACAGSWLLCW